MKDSPSKFTKQEQKQICSNLEIRRCLARRVLCICNVILKHPLFKDIEREETHKLSEISDVIKLNTGQSLFFYGQEVDKVYFVLEGSLKLYRDDDKSEKAFISAIAGKGDGINLESLFGDPEEAKFSSEALVASTVLSLDRKKLKKVIQRNPTIMKNLLSYLSQQVNHLEDSRCDLALCEVSERLMSFLETAAEEADSSSFELSISKTDLAQLLGTIPATLSRALRKLSEEGLISVEAHKFELLT